MYVLHRPPPLTATRRPPACKQTQQAKTQLIAHDREVFDLAFSRGVDVFASVGADGSVRSFDLRSARDPRHRPSPHAHTHTTTTTCTHMHTYIHTYAAGSRVCDWVRPLGGRGRVAMWAERACEMAGTWSTRRFCMRHRTGARSSAWLGTSWTLTCWLRSRWTAAHSSSSTCGCGARAVAARSIWEGDSDDLNLAGGRARRGWALATVACTAAAPADGPQRGHQQLHVGAAPAQPAVHGRYRMRPDPRCIAARVLGCSDDVGRAW
jgi:hypothetical protein